MEPTAADRRRTAVGRALTSVALMAVLALATLVALDVGRERRTPEPTAATPSTVPPLLWMTPGQARDVLAEEDLVLEEVRDERCDVPPGRVTASTPGAGELVSRAGVVDVRVSVSPPAAFCAYPASDRLALRLLDLARFGTHPPRFAAEVEVHVDGRLVRRLSAQQARDPELWGDPSPLAWLDEEASLPEVVEVAAWQVRGDRELCDPEELAVDLRPRPSVQVQLLPEIPATADWASCAAVRVFRGDDGLVDAVAVTGTEASVAELVVD